MTGTTKKIHVILLTVAKTPFARHVLTTFATMKEIFSVLANPDLPSVQKQKITKKFFHEKI